MTIATHFRKIHQTALTEEVKRAVVASIDVNGILQSWNVNPTLKDDQWWGYCPDHFIHAGRVSHAPKWTMNAETGDTFCFTGNFSSNIIYIAKRLYQLQTVDDAIDALTKGAGVPYIPPAFITESRLNENREEEEQKRKERLEKNLTAAMRVLSKPSLSDDCLQFFANDGITADTLKFLGVTSIEKGFYAGRAIIPFINEKRELCGFVAVNYMGKEWMVKNSVDKWCKLNGKKNIEEAIEYFQKKYRKTLYCPGFSAAEHIYGFYEVLNGKTDLDSLMLVEGERDALKMLQEGIDCVSLHGTFIKNEQRIAIKKINPKKLLFGYDMDDAGNKATADAIKKFKGEVEQYFVLNFPEGKDPKKFTGEQMNEIIKNTIENRIVSR